MKLENSLSKSPRETKNFIRKYYFLFELILVGVFSWSCSVESPNSYLKDRTFESLLSGQSVWIHESRKNLFDDEFPVPYSFGGNGMNPGLGTPFVLPGDKSSGRIYWNIDGRDGRYFGFDKDKSNSSGVDFTGPVFSTGDGPNSDGVALNASAHLFSKPDLGSGVWQLFVETHVKVWTWDRKFDQKIQLSVACVVAGNPMVPVWNHDFSRQPSAKIIKKVNNPHLNISNFQKNKWLDASYTFNISDRELKECPGKIVAQFFVGYGSRRSRTQFLGWKVSLLSRG